MLSCSFTVNQGMSKFCKELYDKAGQHETIADRIFELIIKNLNAFQVESKQNRKKVWGCCSIVKVHEFCISYV